MSSLYFQVLKVINILCEWEDLSHSFKCQPALAEVMNSFTFHIWPKIKDEKKYFLAFFFSSFLNTSVRIRDMSRPFLRGRKKSSMMILSTPTNI